MITATLDNHPRSHARGTDLLGSSGTADPQFGGLDLHQAIALASQALQPPLEGTSYGLSLIPPQRAPETVAATDGALVRLDWLQHELRQGPALGPVGATIVISHDLAEDGRWPDFGRMCVAALDLRSLVSLKAPLPGGGQVALTFLSDEPPVSHRLDLALAVSALHDAVPPATRLLTRYGVPLTNASDGDFSRVAVAVNIAMAQCRLDRDRGFERLGRPLLEGAIQTVVAGRLPVSAAAEGASGSEWVRCLGGADLWHDRSECQEAVGG
jgi:hypothetical protein